MGRLTILTLRVVIALSLAGSLVVQTVIVPLLWQDTEGGELWRRITLMVIIVFGVLTMQVFAVCVWQLLTLVRRGAVFSPAAFKWVNIIIGSIIAAAIALFGLAVLMALGEAAPGAVGIVCGFSLALFGMALLVVVMRMLLRQAIDRDAEARALRSEMDEVI